MKMNRPIIAQYKYKGTQIIHVISRVTEPILPNFYTM